MMEANEGRLLLINKPLKWTSFDVVNKLRYKLKIKKIGHAGTLDPLATGLLIICTGKMTKQIDTYQAQEKEYIGKFIIGQTTPSHDLETECSEKKDISTITPEQLHLTTKKFIGFIQQIPPIHSAIKLDGQRAYNLARSGKEVSLKPREVHILEFDITSIENSVVSFRIVCSKGTYIRSIARDYGIELGVGAFLSELCRTRIGNYHLKEAVTVDQVSDVINL